MILHAPTMIKTLRAAADMTAKTDKGNITMLPEAVIKHRIAKFADEIAQDIEEMSK